MLQSTDCKEMDMTERLNPNNKSFQYYGSYPTLIEIIFNEGKTTLKINLWDGGGGFKSVKEWL